MTREEFLELAGELVGRERGTIRRVAVFLGVSENTLYAVSEGKRPVPEAHARRLREALAQADRSGACVPFVGARLAPVVRAAEGAGWSEAEALAAIVAWAGLRLRGAVPLGRSPRPRR